MFKQRFITLYSIYSLINKDDQEQMTHRKLQQSNIDFWLTPTVFLMCFRDGTIDYI